MCLMSKNSIQLCCNCSRLEIGGSLARGSGKGSVLDINSLFIKNIWKVPICKRLIIIYWQKKDKLEHHIPPEFTKARPGIDFSHEQYHVAIADHPLGSRLPKASDRPTVYGYPQELLPLCCRQNSPEKLADYLLSDEPQISFHVASFADTTLISLRWGHWHMDAMGMSAFLKAWSLVLLGRVRSQCQALL